VQCKVCSGSGARAQTRHLHRARWGAVRRLLPDPRRRLVQPATRGARMGAIGARQAITRSSTRRRARLRPRQPARPTTAVRRIRPTQAAATVSRVMANSTSTPTRSAPASAARSCCAPVRPIWHGRPMHRRVLLGTHAVLSGTHRGYSRRAAAVLPCGPSRTAGPDTIGYSRGYYGALTRYCGVLTRYYRGSQVSRSGAEGGARRGTWVGCARLFWLGSRGCCNGCSGYCTVRWGTHWGTDDVHHFVRAWPTARG
jgi:hypothetical protein